MESSDVFGSSTAPLTWHDFLERMRHPSAAEFVKAIKRNSLATWKQHSGHTRSGLDLHRRSWRVQGLEKYVMTKLFTRVFASIAEDVNIDKQLSEKMALIQQFIRPENLDIKPTYQNETSWLLAQKELQKINMYKAPRDKLVCILNCCKVITNLLFNASRASNEDHPGADDFLPALIYVTIKANPPQLHSNLSYIQRFRRQTRLVGEIAYFFTNMVSVEAFITDIDAKSLSMNEAEFEQNMESARLLLSGLSESSDAPYCQTDQSSGHSTSTEPTESERPMISRKEQHTERRHLYLSELSESESRNAEVYGKDPYSLNKIPSISDLENKGAAMLLKEEEAHQNFEDFPYLYSQAGDLTIGEVNDLLNSYKQLVFKYVCLARGSGVTAPSHSLYNAQIQKSKQHGIGKDSERGGADQDTDMQKNQSTTGDTSVEGLSFKVKSSEPKVEEETSIQAGGDENSQRLSAHHLL